MDVSTVKGNKLYTLSFSAQDTEYPKYLSTIKNMISTFVVGSPSSACRPNPVMSGKGAQQPQLQQPQPQQPPKPQPPAQQAPGGPPLQPPPGWTTSKPWRGIPFSL
jgi:hypothetical protein